jgi:serine protease Do
MRKIVLVTLVFTFAGVVLHDRFNTIFASDGPEQESIRMDREEALSHFPLTDRPLDRLAENRLNSYADVIAPAQKAVVTVASESIVRVIRNRGNPMEDFLRRFYGLPSPRGSSPQEDDVQERRVPNGLGSGVLISADGFVLTNNHVVTDERGKPADKITVTLADDEEYEATLIGRDPRTDVAVVKIEGENLAHLPMADSNLLRVGDIVFAIGNPLGLDQTVTMGIVSATGRAGLGLLGNEGYENFIQTDASINMGNSGGALIDAEGRLVGINTAIVSPSGGNIGIGFAIPVNMARNILLSLLENGTVDRGFLGVGINDLDQNLAESFGLKSRDGALVERVQEGSPADKAGLRRGDIILEVNGETVRDASTLRLKIAQMPPGTTVELGIMRDGEHRTEKVTLASLDDPAFGLTEGEQILPGVTLEVPDEEDRERLRVDFDDGLIVREVAPDSPFAGQIVPGMIIREVNGEAVFNLQDMREALRRGPNRLWVYFRGNTLFLGIRVS